MSSNYNEYKYKELTDTRNEMVASVKRGREGDTALRDAYPQCIRGGTYDCAGGLHDSESWAGSDDAEGRNFVARVVFFSLVVVPAFGFIILQILRMF